RPLALEVSGDLGGGLGGGLGGDLGGDLTVAIRGDRVPLRALAALAPAGLVLGDARATGAVTLRRRAGDRRASPWDALELSGDAALDGLVVDHPAFAPAPAPLSGRLHGEATISRDAIAWTGGGLELGAARLSATGWLRRGAALAGQIDLRLATAPCARLFTSLPPELRGPLDGMALDGSLGARLRLAIDLGAPAGEGVSLEGGLEGACGASAEPPAADVTALAAAGEQRLLDGSRRRVGPGAPDHVALRSLPRHVPAAFVSAEDARFYDHAGFDLGQIARSLELDLRERRLARGGSTISQQLVKNAFLSPRKRLDRKLHEAVLAWRLEARLGKREILERYLNVIELGPRVFGLGPAARHWFDRPARRLTVRQAAFLAALASQPATMSRRVRRAGGLDPESAERVAHVLRAMRAEGTLSAEELEDALAAPLRLAPPALAE
ncbi:MAG TPA: biosynthetic peptidoglycan transglycosylase, partial [Kofleriaceae bacterium]|nr:biosynthetic peptidoglycan transglycosylase [Kofleriaceae bacterium]